MAPCLEKSIEKSVVEHAKRLGAVAYKMNGLGTRSWPDRMFLGPGGKVLFIEFKRQGLKPTPLQDFLHTTLRDLGFTVLVVDNVMEGKSAVGKWVGK